MSNVNETYRLQAVQKFYELSDNIKAELQGLAELAAGVCNTPMALLSIVHRDKQYFLGKAGTDLTETDRAISFCTHTIQQDYLFTVNDTHLDKRFANNPLVTEAPHIRFYAGAAIKTDDGHNVGSICVIDQQPRELSDYQQKQLYLLSHQASRLMELNLTLKFTSHLLENQEKMETRLRSIIDSTSACQLLIGRRYEILAFNKAANNFIKKATGKYYMPGDNVMNYASPSSAEIFKICYQKALKGEYIHAERKINYYGMAPSWWEITYSPARDSSGKIIGVAFNALNIDDRKNGEEQIKVQNATLKTIAQLQSHQVRGPLASIIGLIQIIKEEPEKYDEKIIHLLDTAVKQLDDNIRDVVNRTAEL